MDFIGLSLTQYLQYSLKFFETKTVLIRAGASLSSEKEELSQILSCFVKYSYRNVLSWAERMEK